MAAYYLDQSEQMLKEYHFENTLIPCASVICSVVACKMVYGLSQLLSATCFKSYSVLPKLKQIEWDNRAISTAHAIFITIMSSYLAFWSNIYANYQQDGLVIFRSTSLSTFVLGVSVGYFLSDIAMILWFHPSLGGMEYMLHHTLSMAALAYAMLTGEGQLYAFMALISEMTTPGINLRWYLDAAGLKRSKAYVVNGVGIFFTWLVARILLFMYLFCHMYMHYDQIKQLPNFGFYFILVVPCVLAALNLIWFSRITKGMLKTLEKRH